MTNTKIIITLDCLACKVARIFNIQRSEIFMKSHIQRRADARGLNCYWAVSELSESLSALAEQLNLSSVGVSYVAQIGERIAKNRGLKNLW